MAGIEDLVEIYRGENLLEKFKNLRYIKKHKPKWPGIKKVGRFATTKLAHAKEYAGTFPNIIKSAKLDKKIAEFGKNLFDKAHFKQMANNENYRSRLLLPKKAKEKLKIDILRTISSNIKGLTPLALKGLSIATSLPAQIVVMTLTPTEANADEVNMQLEDFAKLAEEATPKKEEKEMMAAGGNVLSTDIKDYYRRAWGIGDRPKFKPGGIVEPGVTHYATTANLNKADQKLLQSLISDANAGNKFTTVEDINNLYYKAKGVDRGAVTYPGSTSKFRPSRTLSIRANPIFNTLETRGDKIEKVLKEMLMDKNSLTKPWRSVLMDKTGIKSYKTIANLLPNSLTFQAIAPEAKFLSTGMGGFTEMYDNLPFAEQLKTAGIQIEGKPVFTGLSKNKVRLLSPDYTVMKIALENWHANKGQGAIQFFDDKGKKINWEQKFYKNKNTFPIHKVSFSYKGKKYNYKKLLEPGVGKKAFPEVYRVQNAIQKLSNRMVNNPFKKGEKINFKDLVKRIQIEGYGWKPKGTIQLLHGIEGVKNVPFKNLSFSTKDINLLENAITKSSSSAAFKKAAINELYKDLKGLGDDEISKLIVKRQINLAKTLSSGKTIPSLLQQKEKLFKILKKAKPGLKLIPFAGAYLGLQDVAKAQEMGLDRPEELFTAYHTSPEIAKGWKDIREYDYKDRAEKEWENIQESWKNRETGTEENVEVEDEVMFAKGGIASLKK